MKNFINTLSPKVSLTGLLAFAVVLMTSCEQDEPFFDQIAQPTGKGYYPVIASTSVNPGNRVEAGSSFSVDLRYWSLDNIQAISLVEVMNTDSTEVFSTGYNPAFSPVTRTDSLIINYNIPIGKPVGTSYVVKVVNENTLKREATVVTVK